ncbi:MAG: hypothetical protein IAG13_35745 [Deltaproteobacteria bacterium]|nr:hypothetical protein [Nannocystaceae bacterium]
MKLNVVRRLAVACACILPACGPDNSHSEIAENSSSASSPGSTSSTAETSGVFESSSATTSAVDESSATGGADACSPAPTEFLNADVGVYANDWPAFGPIEATCTASAIEPADNPCCTDLRLECLAPDGETLVPIRMSFSSETLDTQLDGVVGFPDLVLGFFNPERQINGGPYFGTVSLRDSQGALLLLASQYANSAEQLAVGQEIEMATAGWLAPGSPEAAAWHAPFDSVWLRNAGCAAREALRPGSNTEVPLVIEFDGDEGPLQVDDRTIQYDVPVQGEHFDVIVSDAYYREELTCGDCPVTEAKLLLLRSSER